MTRPKISAPAVYEEGAPEQWHLRLYIAGQSPKSLTAMANLMQLCEDYVPAGYDVEIVDLVQHPHLAAADEILAIPTLVRRQPHPVCKIIGDLSDSHRVLVGLRLRSAFG